MCLPVPSIKLATGVYKDYEWEITHNQLGNRCGYIRLLPGHPWFEKGYNELEDIEIHGGITFTEYGTACPTHGAAEEWWIGFDCAHAGDAADPELCEIAEIPKFIFECGTIRTTEYVKEQIEQLIDQAIFIDEPKSMWNHIII